MANKYTAIPTPPKADLMELYSKGMTQVEVGKNYGVSQKVVFGWFKKLGIESRVPFKRNQKGSNNDSWKGDKATYAALHKRVEVARGKPMICMACGTQENKIFEWCNLTGRYDDVNDYMRMCRQCHRQYDRKRKNSSNHVPRTAK